MTSWFVFLAADELSVGLELVFSEEGQQLWSANTFAESRRPVCYDRISTGGDLRNVVFGQARPVPFSTGEPSLPPSGDGLTNWQVMAKVRIGLHKSGKFMRG